MRVLQKAHKICNHPLIQARAPFAKNKQALLFGFGYQYLDIKALRCTLSVLSPVLHYLLTRWD